MVYSDRVSIVYGSLKYTWKETFQRCYKLACCSIGSKHTGVIRASLCCSHGRSNCFSTEHLPRITTLAVQLKLLEAKVIFVDHQFLNLALQAFEILTKTCTDYKFPLVVLMLETDPVAKIASNNHQLSGHHTYDSLLNLTNGSDDFDIVRPKGECDPISIVFTSGTTGEPKGVVHGHRGAYLTTLAEIILNELKAMPVYL
ncbi:probable acyl-activating enzyme 1, peroxisomal [Durio zibethinus]|uniref:Probable acyl-activating enzyme 1, peroxisomal n=1 Tax=Durio zibethinus TaxID=66656 RepID=A0A6P6ABE3_DURZI|nr:probable acyl-activating enzyme 1, peroxisomal [Durio zibethinus]